MATASVVTLLHSGCGQKSEAQRKLEAAELVRESMKEELKQLEAEQPPSPEVLDARIKLMREEIKALKDENTKLRKELGDYKRQHPLR